MNKKTTMPMPPRLGMDDYADFIENSIRTASPAIAAKQKHIEERIHVPFRIPPLIATASTKR